MTNEIDMISSLSPSVIDPCVRVAQVALTWGRWFIILAFFAALAQTVAAIIVELRPPGTGQRDIVPNKDWLDALKGVLEALVKLPGWVAIFLAGFALLWMGIEAPKNCSGNQKGASTQPAAPTPKPPPASTANHT